MKSRLLVVLLIGLILFLVACTEYELVGQVSAEVVDKAYKSATTTVIMMPVEAGKSIVMIPCTIRHPVKYLVKLQYKDLTITVNDKELYDSVEIGDIVKVNHYKAGNKEKIVFEREGE